MITRVRAVQVIGLLFAITSSTTLTAAHTRYRIEVIGQEPNDALLQYLDSVGGLNNHGEVAFSYARNIQITPTFSRIVSDSYVSTANGIVPVPNLGGQDARALDLTDGGLTVGGASSADSYVNGDLLSFYEPFVSRNGVTDAIPTAERGFSFAAAANEHGDVIGSTWSSEKGMTAFKWSRDLGYDNLGNFGAGYLEAEDINERGDILLSIQTDEILQYGTIIFITVANPSFTIREALRTFRVPNSKSLPERRSTTQAWSLGHSMRFQAWRLTHSFGVTS